MKRFFIIKDGNIYASTADRAEAIRMIREMQSREDHPLLRAQFSIIEGEEEGVGYVDQDAPGSYAIRVYFPKADETIYITKSGYKETFYLFGAETFNTTASAKSAFRRWFNNHRGMSFAEDARFTLVKVDKYNATTAVVEDLKGE